MSFCLTLIITKRKGLLKSIHNVERKSYGELFYPLSIYLIFLLSANRPVIYFISILVMTVSDTMAAVIGGKYGVIKFDVEGNLKSLEGSVVFFFITFLCIHIPLILLTQIGRLESVLIAFIIAILVTGFEAISLSGSDNIIVPFGVCFILTKMTRLPLAVLMENGQMLLLIIALTALLMRRYKLLKPSGLIAIMLLNYGAISLCNFYWFLPLILSEVLYYLFILIFVHYEGKEKVASFQVKALFYVGIIPLLLLFTANTIKEHRLLYLPYLVSIASQIAIIGNFFADYLSRYFKIEKIFRRHKRIAEIIYSILAALFIASMPIKLYLSNNHIKSLFVVIIGTLTAYLLNFIITKYRRSPLSDISQFRAKLISTAAGAGCAFILQ